MKNKCIMKNVEIFRCTCALVGLACTSAFAQVKHASFSEIINPVVVDGGTERSEEHTSELQSRE